jgi:hypothetical protein
VNGVATYTHQHTTDKSFAQKSVIVNTDLITKMSGIEPKENENPTKH